MRFALLALPGLFAALSVQAQTACPTAADLDRGIRLEFADGSLEVFRNSGPGLITVLGTGADGASYRMSLGQGLYLLRFETLTNGQPDTDTATVYDYAGRAPQDLPLPGGKGWTSPVTVTTVDGVFDEPQRHSYGPLSDVQIGDCTYAMREVTIDYDSGDNYREMLRYLPDLGIGYMLWNDSDTLDPNPVEASRITANRK